MLTGLDWRFRESVKNRNNAGLRGLLRLLITILSKIYLDYLQLTPQ